MWLFCDVEDDIKIRMNVLWIFFIFFDGCDFDFFMGVNGI